MSSFCKNCKQTKLNDEFGYKSKCGVITDELYKKCMKCRELQNKWASSEEAKQKRKEYKEKNAEREKEKMKNWREQNKEHIQNYSQHYYQTHQEERCQKSKEYVQSNKEKVAETKKKHYVENKEKIAQRKREYREKNKEKLHEYGKQRWQRRKELRKTDWNTILVHKLSSLRTIDEKKGREFNISKDYVNKMIEDANKMCKWCNCECKLTHYENRDLEQWSIDRIDNNIGHIEGNIVLSCLRCNYKRWHA